VGGEGWFGFGGWRKLCLALCFSVGCVERVRAFDFKTLSSRKATQKFTVDHDSCCSICAGWQSSGMLASVFQVTRRRQQILTQALTGWLLL